MYSYLAWLFLSLRMCERVSTHTRMSTDLYTFIRIWTPANRFVSLIILTSTKHLGFNTLTEARTVK